MRPLSSSEIGNIERQALALARELLGDGDQARDVVQEVLLRLCRGPVPADLNAWVRRVTFTRCADLHRRLRRQRRWERAAFPIEPMEDPGHQVWRAEVRRALDKALAALNAAQRHALVLRVLDELSVLQIAQRLGCSPGTIGSRLHHARLRLAQALFDGGIKSDEFFE